MDTFTKLGLLADGAKYDVSCSSSGSERNHVKGALGNTSLPGICHTWSADGRCVSLLKILLSNDCAYNCAYCVNRRSGDHERASFEPDELAKLFIAFYKRNYVEGLFISSAVLHTPDHTMEQMIQVVKKLRTVYHFNGYIHMKMIPGASSLLVEQAGRLVDRVSINLEVPTSKSLQLLAPQKMMEGVTSPMTYVKDRLEETPIGKRKHGSFVPAGQTTQMMIGASPDTDRTILRASERLYDGFSLKRVYYSAYVPLVENSLLPSRITSPKLREHRLYQADWLMRFYRFKAGEIIEQDENLDLQLDPKAAWALRHYQYFPMEVNTASYDSLLRIPGVGPLSAQRIMKARKFGFLDFDDLRKIGVVMKRAKYFILCKGKYYGQGVANPEAIHRLLTVQTNELDRLQHQQLSLFPMG